MKPDFSGNINKKGGHDKRKHALINSFLSLICALEKDRSSKDREKQLLTTTKS